MLRKVTPLLLCLLLTACAGASPEDAQMSNALSAQGKTLLAATKNTEARDIYASAVERDDNNARAWNGLGVSYDLLGKRDKAQDAYQHAVDLDAHDMTAVNNLAHLYLEKGEAAEAVRLLTPYASDPAAPPTLKQNLATATKSVQDKETIDGGVYADLGSSPTEGMAQGHIAEAKKILGRDAKGLTFLVIPEVMVGGGTPVFTIKVLGQDPQSICEDLFSQGLPCVPHGKE